MKIIENFYDKDAVHRAQMRAKFDKSMNWFQKDGIQICSEIYRKNQLNEPTNFGKLYHKFYNIITEKKLSCLLKQMRNRDILGEKWQLVDGVWIKSVFITDTYIDEFSKLV